MRKENIHEWLEDFITRRKESGYGIDYDKIDYIFNAPITDKEKLQYSKEIMPLLATEDSLWNMSRNVMEIGKNNPELIPQMFDTLKAFAARDFQPVNDVGLPMHDMYRDLQSYFNKTPNFHKNIITIIAAEVNSEQYKNGHYCFPWKGRLTILTDILEAKPETARLVYNLFENMEQKYNNPNKPEYYAEEKIKVRPNLKLVKGKFLGHLINALEQTGNNQDVLPQLKTYYEKLEQQSWDSLAYREKWDAKNKVRRDIRELNFYIEAFPHQLDKAFSAFKENLQLNPIYQDDKKLQHQVFDKFIKISEANPVMQKKIKQEYSSFLAKKKAQIESFTR